MWTLQLWGLWTSSNFVKKKTHGFGSNSFVIRIKNYDKVVNISKLCGVTKMIMKREIP